jgi:nucleoside-diphosphate-sugar epimerase
MRKTVLILGATGRLGHSLLHAFRDAGWRVVAQGRGPAPDDLPLGVDYDRGPLDPVYWSHRYPQVSVVVHAINPHYSRWDKEAIPALRAGIAIARALKARLMFPGNVYNYAFPMPAVIDSRTPERATTRKGAIRVEMERMLAAAVTDGVRSVVLRAGDFIGAERPGTWFDLVIADDIRSGALCYPGPLDVMHAWQDVDMLAMRFMQVAARERELPDFARFNVEGHAVTGTELLQSVERATFALGLTTQRYPLRTKSFPWPMLILGQWLVRTWRELLELRDLWRQPHALDGSNLRAFLGDEYGLPESLDAVVQRALQRDPRLQSSLMTTPIIPTLEQTT